MLAVILSSLVNIALVLLASILVLSIMWSFFASIYGLSKLLIQEVREFFESLRVIK